LYPLIINREFTSYYNSTPKQVFSHDIESRIQDIPFIKFKDYCNQFDFEIADFLKGSHRETVSDITKMIRAYIIDDTTVVPFLFWRPSDIIRKNDGTIDTDPDYDEMEAEVNLKTEKNLGKEIVVVFMDLMSSFTEFIQYLLTINNRYNFFGLI
jgi:hypothetical protein